MGLEGDTQDLAGLNLYSRHSSNPHDSPCTRPPSKPSRNKAQSIRYAFELARKRDKQRKVTITCKYNMLAVADGLFLDIGKSVAREYPDIEFDYYIIDDFCAE